jgi:hypothetical protein
MHDFACSTLRMFGRISALLLGFLLSPSLCLPNDPRRHHAQPCHQLVRSRGSAGRWHRSNKHCREVLSAGKLLATVRTRNCLLKPGIGTRRGPGVIQVERVTLPGTQHRGTLSGTRSDIFCRIVGSRVTTESRMAIRGSQMAI